MDVSEMKTKLHQLIDNTNDEQVLENLYQQLSANTKEDWWQTLREDQVQRLSDSEEQYRQGKVLSNEMVLKKVQQWLQK